MDDSLPTPEPDQRARTTSRTSSHRSAVGERVEIITRREPRRSWTLEQKREIVAESLGADVAPVEVARKDAISSGQLYTWRRQFLGIHTALIRRSGPQFAQVELASEVAPASELPAPARSGPMRAEGLIEIVLAGGVVVRVDGQVDGRALRRVLGVLEGR